MADETTIQQLKILTLGNDVLIQKAAPIQKITPEYRRLAEAMINLMFEGKGVGLAGPQVGRMERIFVIADKNNQPSVFINPTIIATSDAQIHYEEGCLSLPGVWANILRPRSVTVQAWNEKGRPFTLDAHDMAARFIQHENDHLNGVLFIDRLSELKKKAVLAKYAKLSKKR
ncbi:MAG: peptide deformylase [Spirochaetaceae bacterium]|jgi:peptide deformylase|nr:peptide deformylase [Spirochaetaceae bacterium]